MIAVEGFMKSSGFSELGLGTALPSSLACSLKHNRVAYHRSHKTEDCNVVLELNYTGEVLCIRMSLDRCIMILDRYI